MSQHRPVFPVLFLAAAAALFTASGAATAQSAPAGTIDFFASGRPAAARPEPIRAMSFYLLRASLSDIRKEAAQSEHVTDMNQYIDSLSVTPQLKDWMKKHQMVDFVGQTFTKALTPDDIVAIPEYFDAYTKQNGASLGGGIPVPKNDPKLEKKDPEKYARQHEEYKKLLRRYIAANPDTLEGLDIAFRDANPGTRWNAMQAEQQQHIQRRTMDLAQTKYFAAETDTDLNGRGEFTGVAPGSYWITTLDTPALVGDEHLQWDVTVNVHAGEIAHVELSNLNALESTNRTEP